MHQDLDPLETGAGSDINTALLRLAEAVAGHTHLETLLPLVAQLTAEALACHSCLLSLWDDGQASFVPAAAYGLPGRWERLFCRLPIPPGAVPLVDEAVRCRGPVIASLDSPLLPKPLRRVVSMPSGIVQENRAALLLAMPLLYQQGVIGGMVAISGQQGFASREVALMTGIARQTALAVASAHALESERRRRHDLETLQETIRILTTELELETLCQRIAERAALTFSAPAAALFLWDDIRESLPPAATYGLSDDYIRRERIPTDLLRHMFQTQQDMRPFVLPDLSVLPLGDPELIQIEHLRAALVIPLQRGNRFWGLIKVYERNRPSHFSSDVLALAQALGDQTTIALENAGLYREARERSRHLAEVLAAGREVHIQQDTAAILQRIAAGIKNGLGWEAVLITRYDNEADAAYGIASAGLPQEVFDRLRRPSSLTRRRNLYERESFRVSRSYFIPAEKGGSVIAREANAWVAPSVSYARFEERALPPRLELASLPEETPASPAPFQKTSPGTVRRHEQLRRGEKWRPHDFLIVPICGQQGEVLGSISVDLPHHGRRPRLNDVQALEIFADQASVALENARMFSVERRRVAEMSGLAEIAAAFGALTDLPETYRRVTQTVTTLLHAQKCAVVRFSTDMEWGWAEHPAYGLSQSEAESFRFAVTPEVKALMEPGGGQALVVEDVATLPPPLARTLTEANINNALLAFFARRGQVNGMLLVGNRSGGFAEAEARLLLTVAHQAAVAVENAQLFTALHTERECLRTLSNRLAEAQEAERTRIARELHDEAGQALTTVRLQLDFLASVLTADLPPYVRQHVEEARTLIGRTLQEIRRISIDLRPSLLDDLGLIPALRWQCDRLQRHGKLRVHFEAPTDSRRLPAGVETAVYRAVQEALTNIVRHARATTVDVDLSYTPDHLCLTITDDGLGFADTAEPGTSVGLIGMQERLAAVGGTLRIDSEVAGGAQLHIRVPLDP